MSIVERDWTTEAGLRAVVLVQPWGSRCGYVGVEATHKLHGKDYDSVDVEVHGGLTYARGYSDYPADNKGMWWFGYDCAHVGDGRDRNLMDEEYKSIYTPRTLAYFDEGGVVRSLEYCVGECERLAKQLEEL